MLEGKAAAKAAEIKSCLVGRRIVVSGRPGAVTAKAKQHVRLHVFWPLQLTMAGQALKTWGTAGGFSCPGA